ncbi:hypothetical protein [Nocardia phage P3.1]|nr:hypothetical protein [Nocardia phage P3.1]
MATTPAKTTDSETTSAPAPSPKKEEAYVQYIGPASERVLTEEDWANVGAKGQKGATWNFQNQFKLPISKFSENALNYLDTDDRFVILGG